MKLTPNRRPRDEGLRTPGDRGRRTIEPVLALSASRHHDTIHQMTSDQYLEANHCNRCRRVPTSVEDLADWEGDPLVCPNCSTREEKSDQERWEAEEAEEHAAWLDREARRREHLTDDGARGGVRQPGRRRGQDG